MPPTIKTADESEMDSLYTESAEKQPVEAPETIDQEEQSPSTSAVVPLKVLTGSSGMVPKKGDTITVKVVDVYGDEAEISISGGPSGAEEKSAEDEIDEMDVEGLS